MQCVSMFPIDEGKRAAMQSDRMALTRPPLVCVPGRRSLVRHQYIFKIGITCSVLVCFCNEPQGCSHE